MNDHIENVEKATRYGLVALVELLLQEGLHDVVENLFGATEAFRGALL